MKKLIVICLLFVASSSGPPPHTVTLQLQWTAETQFAGYYAAGAKGFYRNEGLDVTIKPGALNIVPQDVVTSGQAQSVSRGCQKFSSPLNKALTL